MGKMIVHEFDPDIYPILLWVSLNATYEGLKDMFDFVPNDDGLEQALESNAATTALVVRKSDRSHGVIVFTDKKSYMEPHIIAHESVHVSDAFFEKLSMTAQEFRNGNEPYAYLVGWVAKCINKAIKTR